jgi:ribosome biogenesis protein MAK21
MAVFLAFSGLFEQPTLAADVSALLKDLRAGPSKKKRDGKTKGDAALRPTENPKPREKKSSDKDKTSKKDFKGTEKDTEVPLSKPTQPRSSATFIFPPTSQWYSVVPPLPATTNLPTPTPTQTSSLLSKATSLHTTDVQNYTTSGVSTGSASDTQFLQKVLQSGTLSDRLSAMTLLVQGSPVHNVKSLESLKNMAERGKGKGGREESLKALRCIVDWWVGGGAPNRKLK